MYSVCIQNVSNKQVMENFLDNCRKIYLKISFSEMVCVDYWITAAILVLFNQNLERQIFTLKT